ncbi:MAG: universal stress protein, partial [Acidimicrobiia bacterium]
MHVLIATAGVLPPGPVAELVDQLLGEVDQVTVMTVIQVPRSFLDAMDEEERRSFLDDDLMPSPEQAEAKAARYLEERGRRLVEPVVAALRGRGREAPALFVEGDDPAEAIIHTALGVGATLIMLGATRRLFDEASWRSVSAKVMEQTHCPLLLVPGHK